MYRLLISIFLLSNGVVRGADSIEPFLQKYCVRCHGGEKIEADIDLRGGTSQIALLQNRDMWSRVLDQLEFEDMPPKSPLPSAEEYQAIIAFLDQSIHHVDWKQFHNPGRMSLARLTTVEYQNAIRDIFGIDLQAGHYLGKDPEGSTGFTNDSESLTFPLFAFDNFMREAERVADAILSYGKDPWKQEIDLVETWKTGSDKSVELNDEQSAVLLKERNAPFQLNLDVPFPGMFQVELTAFTQNGEPISAMHFMVNGKSIERMIVEGANPGSYPVILSLPAGTNVISLGYDPDRAPIIQPTYSPRVVPKKITDRILKPEVPQFAMPDRLKDNAQAKKAWKKLNNTIRALTLTQRLADHLVETDQLGYEKHDLIKNESRQIGLFSPSKVPFNLAAGSVAVFSKIPQAKLEKQIKNETGYSHNEYQKAVKRFKSAWKEQFPERVRKVPGRIALTEAIVTSHPHDSGQTNPREMLNRAATSRESVSNLIGILGERAYGRSMTQVELEAIMRIYIESSTETDSHEEGLRDALVGLLVSPSFLLRYIEQDSIQANSVSQHDLAKRLARFLWLSIPDADLRKLSHEGKLQEPKFLAESVERMIDSPKFDAMTEMFVEQWLDLESLSLYEQSKQVSPHIVFAMRQEPVLLFQHVFRENRSLLELVDADYTFLNDSLALHYESTELMARSYAE